MKGVQAVSKKYIIHKYTVVKFAEENGNKLFECIPDLWFVDELRNSCFFPPKTGKPYTQRAINCEKPQDDWNIYECTVVSSGFATYHAGFKIVKEKCSQRYNTSSAEEEILAANFRRQHPGLVGEGIEHLFSKTRSDGNSEKEKQSQESQHHRKTESIINVETTNVSYGSPNQRSRSISSSVRSKSRSPARSIRSNHTGCSPKRTNSILKNTSRSRQSSKHPTSDDGSTVDERNTERIQRKTKECDPKQCSQSLYVRSKSRSPINSLRSNHPNYSRSRSRQSSEHSISKVGQRHRQAEPFVNSGKTSGSRGKPKRRSRSSSVQTPRSPIRSIKPRSPIRSIRSNHVDSSRSRSRQSSEWSSDGQVVVVGRHLFVRSKSRSSIRSTHSNQRSSGRQRPSRSRSIESRSNRSYSSPYKSTSKRKRSGSCSPRNRSRPHKQIRVHNSGSTHSSRFQTAKQANDPKRNTSQKNIHRTNSKSSTRHKDASTASNIQSPMHKIRGAVHQSTGNSDRPNSMQHSRVHSASSPNYSVKELIITVKELTKAVERNNDKLTQNDRRLNRLEVTINKIFVTVGDMNGNIPIPDEIDDNGFDVPDLPITSKTELSIVHRKLKDKEFRRFWLIKEKDYCCPSKKSTDNVAVTKYLKRFVSVNVRCQMTLMEPGESGLTLHGNYQQVYLFLIDVIKAGYHSCNKKISTDEAHTALRVVWGRSKQLKNNKNQKK